MSDQKIPTVTLNVGAKASVPLNSPDSAIFAWYYSQMQDLYNQMVALLPSSFKTYTDLSQINVTKGQETFENIAANIPLNSQLIYWYYQGGSLNNDLYPEPYGMMRVTKTGTQSMTTFEFIAYRNAIIEGNKNIMYGVYYSAYHDTYESEVKRVPAWNKHNSEYGGVKLYDLENQPDSVSSIESWYSDRSSRVGGLQVARMTVNDELRSRAVMFVQDDEGGYHSVVYGDYSPSQESVLTTLQGIVRIPEKAQFGSYNDGFFGFKRCNNSTDVSNLPQGFYFFYGTAGEGDPDDVLNGVDYQGFSMIQTGQGMQFVCTGNAFLFQI